MPAQAENWPTPTGAPEAPNKNSNQKNAPPSLGESAALWQTPGADSFRSRGGDRIDEPGLDRQARLWATPEGRDVKGEYLDGAMVRNDGKARGDLLPDQASRFSRPTEPETTGGSESSESAPTSRRRLNPRFVAWLMGWPDCHAHSNCESSETESFRLWRQRHSERLQVGSPDAAR